MYDVFTETQVKAIVEFLDEKFNSNLETEINVSSFLKILIHRGGHLSRKY